MADGNVLGLFQAFGVELEYMVVDAATLDVRPIVDELFQAVAGELVSDIEHRDLCWSNELTAHVVELKTNAPAPALGPLPETFQRHVGGIDDLLRPLGARLMPTAMHPWMDPAHEMRLWPLENGPVYRTFDRIFDCRGHGWANLQSVHLNLPFAGDAQFAQLHAAVRLVLPILPAIAASSPFIEGRATGLLDSRLDVYRTNARRVPSVSGRVIPEPVYDRASYERDILGRIYADIAPHDPEGIVQHEWLNARGAIARFDRNTIEIRVLDIQECPAADVAICAAIVAVLQALVGERWTPLAAQRAVSIDALEPILLATIRDADEAVITDREYLAHFGWTRPEHPTAGDLWRHLDQALGLTAGDGRSPLGVILREGPLARRILRAVGTSPQRAALRSVYADLCDCLVRGVMLHGQFPLQCVQCRL